MPEVDNKDKVAVLKQQITDEATSNSLEQLEKKYGADLKGLKDEMLALQKKILLTDNQNEKIPEKSKENNLQKFALGITPKGYFTGVGEEGGYYINERNVPTYFDYLENNSIVRPRSFNIPADRKTPDAKVTMLKLQQDAAGSFSECTFYPVGEGHDFTETDSKISMFALEPKGAGAMAYMSNTLRRNAAGAEKVVGTMIKRAAVKYENSKFFSGLGGHEPKGFQNSPAMLSVDRNTASQVKLEDILAMEKVSMLNEVGNYVWLASQSTFSYLKNMVDSEVKKVLVGNKLDGIPLIWTDSASALGVKNDIMLCNFQYYVTYIGTSLKLESSPHYKFGSNIYSIRAEYTCDGDTWLDKPIKRDDDTYVSPFIGLAKETA